MEETVGEDGGRRRWEKTVGEDGGRRRWEKMLGDDGAIATVLHYVKGEVHMQPRILP
jgi:hypothetical protein